MRYSSTLLFTITLSAALSLAKGGLAAPRNHTKDDFRQWTDTIEKARTSVGVQGMSVAVVYKGETIYTQAFGKRNDKDPFTVETLTCIASLTKAFTAAAIGELVAEGKADWETPINEYFPHFKSKNPYLTAEINFVDLLSHRTGYPSLDVHWFHRNVSRTELIKDLRHVEPVAPLRSKWIYNNVMYGVAGEASARLEGKTWEDVVRDRILIPAGMNSSGLSIKTMLTRPNHALPYGSKSFEAAQRMDNYQVVPDTHYMADAPAGDIYSNVLDLAKWAKLMLRQGKLDGKQVLNKDTVESVTKRWFADENVVSGLGWFIQDYKGHHMVHHSGGWSGYYSYIAMFPNDDLAVVVLSNKENSEMVVRAPLFFAESILDLPKTDGLLSTALVAADKIAHERSSIEALDQFFPPQVKNKPPTHRLRDFAGEWTHPYGTPISIIVNSKGRLAIKMADYEGVLEHHHYDSFRHRLILTAGRLPLFLSFITGDDGSVDQLRITLNDKPLVYTRVVRS
ncbi:hypothetical protein DFQ26_000219 [Actinomortierella ambigua]|nr:hypothetical protein DFQ26_000219 [Actinomortierella ambigua]